jgi:O-antigen ligase
MPTIRNILGVIFLLPLLFPYSYLVQFYGFNLLDVFLVLAIMVSLIFEWIGRPINFIRDKIFMILIFSLILLTMGGAVGLYLSDDKISAIGYLKSFLILPVTYGYALFKLAFTRQRMVEPLAAIVIGCVLFCVASLALSPLFDSFFIDGRFRSIFNSPNYLALYILPGFTLSLFYLSLDIKNYRVSLPIVLVLFLSLILTLSRSALAGAFMAIIISMLILYKEHKKLRSIILVSLLLFTSTSFGLLYYITSQRTDSSNNIRIEIWKKSIEIIKNNPIIGTGIGDFQKEFEDSTKEITNFPEFIIPQAQHPHNTFLAIYIEYSIFGLLGFLVFLLGILLVSIKFLKGIRSRNRAFVILFVSIFITLGAILSSSTIDTNILKNDLAVIFFSLSFLALSFKNLEARMIDE